MMINLIIIFIEILLTFYLIWYCYHINKKEIEEQEYRLLKLEERVETQKLELHGRINALLIILSDMEKEIEDIRKKVNKNAKRSK